MRIKIEKDNLIINIADLLYDFKHQMNEDELLQLIELFAWTPKLFKEVVKMLSSDFSRENYNEFIHEGREEFLKKVKEEEVEFYADKIAKKVEETFRVNSDYWKLYHYVKERYGYSSLKDYPKPDDIDFKLRKELVEIVKEGFKNLKKRGGT